MFFDFLIDQKTIKYNGKRLLKCFKIKLYFEAYFGKNYGKKPETRIKSESSDIVKFAWILMKISKKQEFMEKYQNT